jgi:HEAT repeat protein
MLPGVVAAGEPRLMVESSLVERVGTAGDAAVLAQAFGSADEAVLLEVAKALTRIDAALATPILTRVLEFGDPPRQWVAARVLGLQRARDAAPALRRAAMSPDLDLGVRQHAIEALGYVDDGRSVPDLTGLLLHISPEIRFWTAFALGQIGDGRSLGALQRLADEADATTRGGLSVRHAALDALEIIRAREKRR